MPISNYTELKAAISDWMARSDVNGSASDFISLAEARLNRALSAVEVDANLTATAGSNEIDVSGLPIDRVLALFLKEYDDELVIDLASNSEISYFSDSGLPSKWVYDNSKIKFDRPCDINYPVRLRYDQKFELSDAAPTNWLLTNHPDLYLAASIAWGSIYVRDDARAEWGSIAEQFIPQVRAQLAKNKRGVLRPDPALGYMTSGRHLDWDRFN